MAEEEVDVAIVGAGAAGTYTAWRLVTARADALGPSLAARDSLEIPKDRHRVLDKPHENAHDVMGA